MKAKMMPVVSASDIEREVLAQFGVDIEIRQLFWEGEHTNDSYKTLHFRDLVGDNDIEWYGEEAVRQMNMVYAIMQDEFPMYDSVLVNVSW